MRDNEEDPVTAFTLDDFGVPNVEARGDFLVLRRKIDHLARYSASSVEPLTDEDFRFLRQNLAQVPNTLGLDLLALKVRWIA